jgi:hypothetical protein
MSHPNHGRPSPSRQRLAATVPRPASAGQILATAQPHPSHGRPSPRYPSRQRLASVSSQPRLGRTWPWLGPSRPHPGPAWPHQGHDRPHKASPGQAKPLLRLAGSVWPRTCPTSSDLPHLAMAWPQPATPRPSLAAPRPRPVAPGHPRPGRAKKWSCGIQTHDLVV